MFQKLKFTGLALAGIMTVSAVSLPVLAATSKDGCPHNNTKLSVKIDYTDPSDTQHLVVKEYIETCTDCWQVNQYSNVYWEDHEYEYNYTTNEYHCPKCGDHYK